VLATGAHAFLAAGGAIVIAMFEAEKNVLELIHSRVGEKQRGIVRGDERRAAHNFVPALLEKVQERLANSISRPLQFAQCAPRRFRLMWEMILTLFSLFGSEQFAEKTAKKLD
jgi:hypothetical protein